jgi:hypothetical protein
MLYCGKCDAPLPADAQGQGIENMAPCVGCGARAPVYKVMMSATLRLLGRTKAVAFSGKSKKKTWFIEHFQGFGRSVKTATGFAWKERRLDKREDTYHERVEDEDGNVIHACDEPLSEHRGHGSARKNARPD